LRGKGFGMNRHQLGAFRCSRNDATGDVLLLASGSTRYKRILVRAFPNVIVHRSA